MSLKHVGGYEVVRRLGAGGMGEVLLARDPKLERHVAIKVLRSDFAVDPLARRRFHREARSLAALRHPGVVTIYEIGEDDGLDFIVMEFLEGTNLRTHMVRNSMDQERILELASQIVDAIAGAHGAGVLHRDIKPENIMVLADGSIRVVDFGLARGFDEVEGASVPSTDAIVDLMGDTVDVASLETMEQEPSAGMAPTARRLSSTENRITANTETILGTPAYMAPELFLGTRPSATTDLYSFGVLLYEMFSGALPFDAKDMKGLLDMLVFEHQPPSRLDEQGFCAKEAADLVHELLDSDPEGRPNMSELLSRLGELTGATTEKVVPGALPAESSTRAKNIEPAATRRPRRWRRLLTAAAIAGIAIGGLYYRGQVRSGTTTVDQTVATPLPANSIRIAVKPFSGTIPSYSHAHSSVGNSAATVTASLLNRAAPIRAIPPSQLLGHMAAVSPAIHDESEWLRAGHDVGAMYLVDTRLADLEGTVSADVSITNLLDRSTRELGTVKVLAKDFDTLMHEVASKIVAATAPGEVLIASETDARRSIDSLALYEQALQDLYDNEWVPACVKLEQIVREQPAFFEAWYHLAIASAWAAQPTEKSLHAANQALELASTDRDRDLMEAIIAYTQKKFLKAVPMARELAKRYPRDPEVAYLYAESVYHDGHYQQGLELFDNAIRLAPRSNLPTTHPIQHAEANGNEERWDHYHALRATHTPDDREKLVKDDRLYFALGEYEALLAKANAKGELRVDLLSTLQRDELLDAELAKKQELQGGFLEHAMARATELGQRERAQELFKLAYARIAERAKKPGHWYDIRHFPEILIIGDMKDELREFLGYWSLEGPNKNTNEEAQLRSFSANLLDDASLIRRDGFGSWREAQQARALRAEMEGRLEQAADIWAELLADPSQWGDLLERVAFARTLHKLGRKRDLRSVCLKLLRPTIWQTAYSVTRMKCREWGAIPQKRDSSGAFSVAR